MLSEYTVAKLDRQFTYAEKHLILDIRRSSDVRVCVAESLKTTEEQLYLVDVDGVFCKFLYFSKMEVPC